MNRRIIAAVDDIFFAAKIRGTAEHLGIPVDFARSIDALVESAERELPDLFIVDLHSQRCEPFALIERLKADANLCAVPVVGFFSHVQTELQQRANEAGIDRVLPRSAFTKRLPEILQGEF